MNDHNLWIAHIASEMKLQPPPSPWVRQLAIVSTMDHIGYAENSDLLLVVSETGRGVFDCMTGELVARDTDSNDQRWHDYKTLSAHGIGPIAGQNVRLMGDGGGGLNTSSYAHDTSWRLELIAPNWPLYSVVLCKGVSSVVRNQRVEDCTKIAPSNDDGNDILAFGFSQTGKSFVVATRSTLEMFAYLSEEQA